MCLKSVYPANAHICTTCAGRLFPKTDQLSCPGLLTSSGFFILRVIHISYNGCKTLCHLLPLPFIFLILSPLTLLYHFTPAWWAPGYFSSPPGLLLPSNPALVFSSSTCIAPPGILLTLSLTASKASLKCHPPNKPTLVTF